jgi:hypothetical protein
LPEGASWRFRYRRNRVERAVVEAISAGALAGQAVLTAIAGTRPDGSTTITPIRQARVRSAAIGGDLVLIDLELDAYLGCDPGTAFEDELRAMAIALPELADDVLDGVFCRVIPRPGALRADAGPDGWELTAHAVLAATDPSRVPFMFGVFANEGLVRSHAAHEGLELVSGSSAMLDIHTVCRRAERARRFEAPIGELKLTLQHQSLSLLTSSTVRIDTSRNAKTIALSAAAGFSVAKGHLAVIGYAFKSPSGSEPGGSDPIPTRPVVDRDERCPAFVRLDIPITTGRRNSWMSAAIIATAVGFGALGVGDLGTDFYRELLRVTAIAVLAMWALRRGLDVK